MKWNCYFQDKEKKTKRDREKMYKYVIIII